MRPDGPRDSIVGPATGPAPPFPLKLDGKVVSGFGRGSKELGIPTANIPVEGLSVGGHEEIQSGVYYGWAGLSLSRNEASEKTRPVEARNGGTVDEDSNANATAGDAVYPMVMSIGWNPFYKNTVRSVEVHILHHFPRDFYGAHMNLLILGFIRPEYDYVSKESLIEDIRTDIEVTRRSLAREAYQRWRDDGYLLDFRHRSDVAT
ncbi:MAG: riboflavin kinase [Caeruleum heppii]|nr:MAG: riboflavin kinase [Caeruleum heppii]